MIPAKGTRIEAHVMEMWDEDREYLSRWYTFFRHAYEGRGGFLPTLKVRTKDGADDTPLSADDAETTYLDRFARESPKAFDRRAAAAYYDNPLREEVIRPLVGFLTKQPPSREYEEGILDWLSSKIAERKSYDGWLTTRGIAYAYLFGSLPVLIEPAPLPPGVGVLTEEQRLIVTDGKPVLKTIAPENIMRLARHEDGEIAWLKYRSWVVVTEPLVEPHGYWRYTWITSEGWWWVDDDRESLIDTDTVVLASGQWPESMGGRPPVAELMFFGGETPMWDLGPICRCVFNLASELRQIQRGPCFPILCIPKMGKQEIATTTLGTANALPFEADWKHKPYFLTPPTENAEHLAKTMQDLVKRLQEIGGTGSIFSSQAEKPTAMQFRFQPTAVKLSAMADGLTEFESRVLEIYGAWTGANTEGLAPTYPRDFDPVDLERTGSVMDRLNEVGAPQEVMAFAVGQLLESAFPNVSQKIRDELTDALDKWIVETKAQGELERAAAAQGFKDIEDKDAEGEEED